MMEMSKTIPPPSHHNQPWSLLRNSFILGSCTLPGSPFVLAPLSWLFMWVFTCPDSHSRDAGHRTDRQTVGQCKPFMLLCNQGDWPAG